jgi:hypothetical protein
MTNVGPIIHETTHGNRFTQAGNSLGLSGEPDGKSQSPLQHQQYCSGSIVMNTPMDPMHSSAFGSGRPMMIMPDSSRNFAMRPDLEQYGLRVRLREEGYFEECELRLPSSGCPLPSNPCHESFFWLLAPGRRPSVFIR